MCLSPEYKNGRIQGSPLLVQRDGGDCGGPAGTKYNNLYASKFCFAISDGLSPLGSSGGQLKHPKIEQTSYLQWHLQDHIKIFELQDHIKIFELQVKAKQKQMRKETMCTRIVI